MKLVQIVKLFLITAMLGIIFAANSASAQDRPPAAVETASARSAMVAPTLWVPGTVISRHDSLVAAEVSGILVWVAEVGEQISKGQPMARLNDREMQLQLRNNQSNVDRLTARLEFLQRQVKRISQLAKANRTAESELDQLTVERDMLAQELVAAEVSRDRTLYDIERTKILAPFDGVVAERMQQPGEYLERGSEVIRLVNTSDLEIRVQAPLSVARYVHEGNVVNVKNAEQLISTRVRTVIPVGDERSRMLQLRLELQDVKWVIGEAVRVALNNGTPTNALTVPRDALILRNGETYLYKVDQDNTARRVDVVTGDGDGDHIAVLGKLKDGDKVIIRGAERLQDGRAVVILDKKLSRAGLG